MHLLDSGGKVIIPQRQTEKQNLFQQKLAERFLCIEGLSVCGKQESSTVNM